jgi:MFS family permease
MALIGAQTMGSVATTVFPAVAPEAARSLGMPSSWVGYQISLLAAFMLVSQVFGGGFTRRLGACRVTQIALLLIGIGSLLAIVPHPLFPAIGTVALGLGYGAMTPAGSHLLMRFTPGSHRNVIFSIKQAGVPLGGIVAAAVAPLIAVTLGWRWAFGFTALIMVALAASMQGGRSRWDDDREPTAALASNPFAGLALAWRQLDLRLMSIAGACLCFVQICVSTYTVVTFVEELGYGLVQAGLVLTASQVGGVFGRLFWGWVADRVRDCPAVLSVLSAIMVGGFLLAFSVTAGWPVVVVWALFFLLGATSSGWNGAYLAEVARLSPPRLVSHATGGSLAFVNAGKLLAPIVFVQVYALTRSYTAAFASLAVPSLVAIGCLLVSRGIHAVRMQPAR